MNSSPDGLTIPRSRPRAAAAVFAAVLLLIVSGVGGADAQQSSAAPQTVDWMFNRCRSGAGAAWCEGYLTGAADMLGGFGNGGHKAGVCGAAYTPAMLRQLFLTWARENPSFGQLPMAAGAATALRRRWPC